MKTIKYKGQSGNLLQLFESNDMVIVRTRDLFNPLKLLKKHSKSFDIENINKIDDFPEASVFLFKLQVNKSWDKLSRFKKIISDLKDPRIRFIGTLYKNKYGSYQIYTGNIFLKFSDHIPESQQPQLINDLELEKKKRLNFGHGAYFLEPTINLGRGIFEFCEKLLLRDDIEFCHPEIVVKRKSFIGRKDIKENADDVLHDSSWAHEMIKLNSAWSFTKGKNIKICIIDDGIDIHHPAFNSKNKLIKTIDMFGDEGSDASHKFDSEMHGTACASIACSNDPLAIGVAPEAELMVVRTKGLGSVLEAEAIRWAVDEGADIISCSWGPSDGLITDPGDDHIEHLLPDHTRLAIEYAVSNGRNKKGCLVFFAAGNGKELIKNDGYASNPNVMAIGSINKEGKPTGYTDHGYPLFCTFPSSEIIIDGDQIIHAYGLKTADRSGKKGYSGTDYYSTFGGTSASCPGMAGVAALMLSINNELSLNDAKDLIRRSCVHPKDKTIIRDAEYGYGIIDAHQLVINTKNHITTKTDIMSNQSNSKNLALHIALNEVNPDIYNGSKLELAGCVNDAEFYSSLCDGFQQNKIIKNSQATRNGFIKEIKNLVQQASAGDNVFITYAGHGSFVNDESGDEDDNNMMDETLVLYDGLMIDDEINNMLADFDKGVNVHWIADSCHSGSNSRNFQISAQLTNGKKRYVDHRIAQRVFNNNANYYRKELEKLPQSNRGTRDELIKIKANLLTFGACTDNQLAGDGEGNGLFTGMLKKIYHENNNITYSSIHSIAHSRMPVDQKPVLTKRGIDHHTLDQTIFFEPTKSTPDPTPDQEEPKEIPFNPFYFIDSIILDNDYFRSVKIKAQNNSSRGFTNRNLKVSQSTLAARDIQGDSPWDKAYGLIMNSSADNNIQYAEPDLVSAINANPDSDQSRSGEYIETYPNPIARNNKNPLIWHLDKNHSQLRKAFKRATLKEELEGGLTEQNKDTFPLIAHIDTGILPHHVTTPENFREDLSEGFADPIDKDKVFGFLTAEQQGHGHSTLTLLAGAKITKDQSGSDYKGYLGAFPYARVASLRISETVVLLSGKKFAKAVRYAVDKLKADVITMSMAGAPSMRMLDAVNYAYEKGVLIVSAAGNSWSKGAQKQLPSTVMYPARFNRVIGVTGATYDDVPYLVEENKDWESRAEGGKYMQTCYGPKKLMDTIMAAYTPNVVWANKENGKGIFVKSGGGTSSATPQVAAAAALWLHHHKDLLKNIPEGQEWRKVEAVRKALFTSAHKSFKHVFGNGILRANNALKIKPTKDFISNLSMTPADTLTKKWLGSLLDMFNGRSINNINSNLRNMLSTEIEQLIMTEPDLEKYRSGKGSKYNLKIALLKNKNSSDYLKKVLSVDKDVRKFSFSKKRSRNSNLEYYSKIFKVKDKKEDKTEHLIITTSDSSFSASKIKLNKRSPENLITTVKIDLENKRGIQSNFSIRLPENKSLSYLICEEDTKGKKHYTWHHPGMNRQAERGRSLSQQNNKWEISLEYNSSRGLFRSLKNIFISVFNIVTAKALSDYPGLRYRDIKDQDLNWHKVTKSAATKINKQNKTLYLSHGTLSSIESSFKGILEGNQKFIDDITNKGYGSIVVGYNMDTVSTSISANASVIKRTLKSTGLDISKLTVLGHSRGCLVAREVFDATKIKMVLTAGPHLGTPLAHKEFIPSLLDSMTNMAIAVSGLASPIVAAIPSVLNMLLKSHLKLTGITDMQEEGEFIKRINKEKPLTKQQVVIGTDWHGDNKFKCIIDSAIDKKVFDNEANDVVIPYDSTLSEKQGNPIRIRSFGNSHSHHMQYYYDKKIVSAILKNL